MNINSIEIILYVADQCRSAGFYSKIFRKEPSLDVPGMTEFVLSEKCKLGLMPNRGIEKIIANKMPPPDSGSGIPRCELYLDVNDIEFEYENALKNGAKLISPIEDRNWGDRVCYLADHDGHIIAFAERIKAKNQQV